MAINNFKAFALDPNANVMSQTDWEALPALLSGFNSGKASSAQVNKAIRQATTIAALVGQFIANSGADTLDNGDIDGLVTKFTNALTTNLGLGDIATHSASEFLPSSYIPPAAPVTSVNGKTGDVQLAASDVHALPDTYVPPAPDLSGYETISDANARFVQRMQLGAEVSMGKVDEYGCGTAPAGCLISAVRGDPSDQYGTYTNYKPIQQNINGIWATISG